ncbi:hypothetical protein ABE85_03715 [Mitsuaria sp. 7]|nr:hypothetical protein ABE85_03715 [Mitsuaria sp. 7]
MALTLLGAMSLGALQVQQFQQMVESGRQAGLRLASLRDGAERYVRHHGHELLALKSVEAACAEIPLSQTPSAPLAPLAGGPPPAACGVTLDKQRVRNAFQPSIQELQQLGYVDLGDTLPFPHGNLIVDGRTGQSAEPRWAVSVRCQASCDPAVGGGRAAVFRVMLYNTQPFFAQGDLPFGYGAQLKAALQALGPDARVSLPGESAQVAAQLRGKGAQPVDNPLQGDSAGTGVPGVLASYQLIHPRGGSPMPDVACGVASSASGASAPGASGATCRDGSAVPTARWDFNGQQLHNVGDLGVTGKAGIGGELTTAGTIHANGGLIVRHPTGGHGARQGGGVSATAVDPVVDIHGHAVVRKRLMVGHGSHWNFAGHGEDGMALSGVLHTSNGYIDTSSGQAGGPAFDPRLHGIRIPHRSPGQACNERENNPKTSGGNIALYRQANSAEVYVMACNAQGQWVKAKAG